jgi:hypothetical protein
MTQPRCYENDDQLCLDETQLEGFNAYYSKFLKMGSSPLSLEEAQLVLQLMSAEQRWTVMAQLRKKVE